MVYALSGPLFGSCIAYCLHTSFVIQIITHTSIQPHRPTTMVFPLHLSSTGAVAFLPPWAPASRFYVKQGPPPVGTVFVRGLQTSCRLIAPDRKSTRLNSSHVAISYAGFC